MNNVSIILLVIGLAVLIRRIVAINSENKNNRSKRKSDYFSLLLVSFWTLMLASVLISITGAILLKEHSKLASIDIKEVDSIVSDFSSSDSYIYPTEDGLLFPLSEESADILYRETKSGEVVKIDDDSKDVKILVTDNDSSTVTINEIEVQDGFWSFLFNKTSRTEYLFTIGVDNSNTVKSLEDEVEELSRELSKAKEESLVYRDKLNQIEMRNEGIKTQEEYQEGLDEE